MYFKNLGKEELLWFIAEPSRLRRSSHKSEREIASKMVPFLEFCISDSYLQIPAQGLPWGHNALNVTSRQDWKICEIAYPSPVSAQQAWICHLCWRIDWRLSCLEISAALRQPLTSCLLAKTRMLALLSSSWPIILWSSSLVMLNLSRSVESTTRITNWNDTMILF